jgi:peptidyl-prolyl cis-trans isomerase B (cyclophilin B)
MIPASWFAFVLAAGLAAAEAPPSAAPDAATPAPAPDNRPRVELTTSLGTVTLALDPAAAPATVENFLAYVRSGHYDGTVFHRVIPGFMIQGGGYTVEHTEKPKQSPIMNEANNGRRNLRGTVAMARTNNPHSASSQFFINVADNAFLDHRDQSVRGWGYCVFGEVVAGMEVVDAISKVPTGPKPPFPSDVPREPVLIQTAKVLP